MDNQQYNQEASLRKFHLLDEVENNDSDSRNSASSDSDIPDEEIDKLLEDALNKKKRTAGEAGLGGDGFSDLPLVIAGNFR